MKFATFTRNNNARKEHAGVLIGDEAVDLTGAGLFDSVLDVVRAGPAGISRIKGAFDSAPRVPRAEFVLAAPIRPGKILCSGINYRSHAIENPDAVMPEEPFFFAKLPSSVIGPDTPIEEPARTRQMDYEVEFAAVIGQPLHKAPEAAVMPAIFGYTLLNDISARDVQFKDAQITIGKNFAGFAPIGPVIVTADELTEPGNVRLGARLNGRTVQEGTTADWVFPLPNLISFLSHYVPLEPGDIVTTGTPAGVGVFRKPPVFMHAGDVIEIEAEGIGILTNPIVAS